MKIETTIDDSALEDVKEYCRVTETDLHGRMQQELDKFVDNAVWWIKQKRQIREKVQHIQESIKEFVNT